MVDPSCVRTLLISSGTVETASAAWSGLSLASCNRSWPSSTGAAPPIIGGSANSTAAVSYVGVSARSRALARLSATALVAAVGNRQGFKNGRQFAAWLGLVPKQRSSGGRDRLFGISKRGDRYL